MTLTEYGRQIRYSRLTSGPCDCIDCRYVRSALELIRTIARSDESMGWIDIACLCKAESILAALAGDWSEDYEACRHSR